MTSTPTAFRRMRKRRGWTQRQLAERLGVDAMTVSRWERGLSRPQRAIRDRLDRLVAEAGPTATRSTEPRAPATVSDFERIDELVRVVGSDRALRALRQLALLERRPLAPRFVADPYRRMQEVEAALAEQYALLDRAQIG